MKKMLFGTNGIRGVINVDLTPEFVTKIGMALGAYFSGKEILVGCDCRLGNYMIKSAVVSGLISSGCSVSDAELIPTPALQYAVKYYGFDGGVIITASHNPPEYNGIKVVGENGIELPREEEIKIEEIFFEEKFKLVEWRKLRGVSRAPNVIDPYIEAIEKHVDLEAIRKKKFRIVVDSGNGVSVLTVPKLLQNLGCEVSVINAELDGTFPSRPPEPKPENLNLLCEAVRSFKADFGVAFDGDGDRAIFVDEKGTVHWGDKSFALIEDWFLGKNKNKIVVTPVSSSTLIEDVAKAHGGKIYWTKVGSIVVSHTMVKIGALLGGEENGGVFYGLHQPVRDGAMTTALILEILTEENKSLSELISKLPEYYIVKASVPCPEEIKEEVLEELKKRLKAPRMETIDGIKLWFSDGRSILIRPSGTEPKYRLYAEARSEEEALKLVEEYSNLVRKIVKMKK